MTTESGSTGSSGDPRATKQDTADSAVDIEKDRPEATGGDRPADPREYVRVAASDEFGQLRRTFRGFVFPMTVAFLAWYLLYVVLSAYARDFMATKIIGNLNVAFVFGVLQFVSTFLIAWWYARFASSKLDPVAGRIRDRLNGHGGGER